MRTLADAKCGCGRFTRNGFRKGECRLCWKWFTDPAFLKVWGPHPFGDPQHVPPVEKVKMSLPCIHVGESLTVKEKEAAGLSKGREWHWCKIGLTKNKLNVVGVAGSCEGCGSKCEGYQSRE